MNIQQKDYEQYLLVKKARTYLTISLLTCLFAVGFYIAPILAIIYLIQNKDFRKFVFSHLLTALIVIVPMVAYLMVPKGPEMQSNMAFLVAFSWSLFFISTSITILRGYAKAQKGKIAFYDEIKNEIFILLGKKGVNIYQKEVKMASKQGYESYCDILNKYHEMYESKKDIVYTPEEAEKASREIVVAVSIFEDKKSAKKMEKSLVKLYKERNHEKIRDLYAEYEPRMNEYIADLKSKGEATDFVPECDGKSDFDGKLIQMIGWNIACSFVGIITLGFGIPAAICMKQRWLCKHTIYQGKRLEFDGKGLQLLGTLIKWSLLSVITLGIYALFIPLKLENWKAKHTHLAGEYKSLGGCFDGKLIPMFFTNLACGLIIMFTLGLCLPMAICKKQKWLYKHRVYDGRRLKFTGKGMGLLGTWIKWILLSMITFGIYAFFVPIKLEKWMASHVVIEDKIEVAV